MSTTVELFQQGPYQFNCTNALGKSAVIDGPVSIGGGEDGVRPMEMILMGLAGCSSFDLLSILKKQRQAVDNLYIKVNGDRSEGEPAVFTKIEMIFEIQGNVDQKKLDKALSLSVDKYCSVAKMLKPTVEISWKGIIKSS
jgi:putative redox protein